MARPPARFQRVTNATMRQPASAAAAAVAARMRAHRQMPPPIYRAVMPDFAAWQRISASVHAVRRAQVIPPATPEMILAAKLYRLFTRSSSAGERAAAGAKLQLLITRMNFTAESVAAFAATEVQ